MVFKELTYQGEELLKEILEVNEYDCDRQEEYWHNKFSELTDNEDTRLRSVFSELEYNELLKIMWADDIPYIIDVNNYGYTYLERKQNILKKKRD